MADDRRGREQVEVDRRGATRAGARGGDLLHHHAGLRDAEPEPAVLLGDERAEPSALGERLDELPRVLAALVLLTPVRVVELAGQLSGGLADDVDGALVGVAHRWLSFDITSERGTLVVRERSHSPSALACASSRSVDVAPVPSNPRMRKLTAPRLGIS